MNTFVFLTAYGLADDLLRCYDAANGDGMTWLLFLHSQRPDVVAACERLTANANVVYFPYGENRGMSKSINEAIEYAQDQGADVFLSINDDVLCPDYRARELAATALANPLVSHVEARGYTDRIGKHEPLGFSCCAWNMQIFDTVGFFDENFHPFYFMDCDWKYRAWLLYANPAIVLDMPDVIHAGSKTLTHVPGEADWLAGAFENTKTYYLEKWGGDQKLEIYPTPFNDPACGLRIDYADRADPYPAHRPMWLERVR